MSGSYPCCPAIDIEHHIDCLKKLCRVCACFINKHKVTYDCTEKSDKLAKYLNITTSTDVPTIHPPRFCNCYRTLKRIEGHATQTSLMVTYWTKHPNDHCETRNRYVQVSKGGPKPKARKGGQHLGITNGQIIQVISSLTLMPEYATTQTLISPSRFTVPPSPI